MQIHGSIALQLFLLSTNTNIVNIHQDSSESSVQISSKSILDLRDLVTDKTTDVKDLREKIQGLSHVLKTIIHNADKITQ